MLDQVVSKIYSECQAEHNNANAGYNSLPIGLLTVDWDDESAAQMLYLYSFFKKYQSKTFVENISELDINYIKNVRKVGRNFIVDSFSDKQCKPVWEFLSSYKVTCLINQYPKEMLVSEIERDELVKYDLADIRTFEPWWKLILGNKALLPLLW